MIDKFVLLTPLIILPILLLFAFVGCAFHTEGEGGTNAQATLIFLPVAFQNIITSLTVTFTLTWTPPALPGQFQPPPTSLPVSKKLVPPWSAGKSPVQLNWPDGSVDIVENYTMTCHIDFTSTDPALTVVNNDATKTITDSNNINATFMLTTTLTLEVL